MKNYLDLTEFQNHPIQVGVFAGNGGIELEYAITMTRYLVDGGLRAQLIVNPEDAALAWYTVSATEKQIGEWNGVDFPPIANIGREGKESPYQTSFCAIYHMLRAMNGVPSTGLMISSPKST